MKKHILFGGVALAIFGGYNSCFGQSVATSVQSGASGVAGSGNSDSLPPNSSADAATAHGGGLADIVVTARKRVENLQNVPVAVSAIASAEIRRQDLTSLEKVAAYTPGLTIGRASNGSGAQMTLRGIGSSSTSIGIEQSVAVVVDNVYYGQGRIIDEGFFDLARVEVLKGPQALFFGKNATAGVISITTAEPTAKPEFIARSSYEFGSQEAQLEAIASGPITDTFGIRAAIRGSRMFGGYIKNIAHTQSYDTFDVATGLTTDHVAPPAPTDVPQKKELVARITAKWQPTSRLTATLIGSGSYNKDNVPSWNYVAYRCPTGFSALNPIYACGTHFITHQNNIPTEISANLPYGTRDGSSYNRYKSAAVTSNINYVLDHVTLTSVTNYNWNNNALEGTGDFQSSDHGVFVTEDSSWRAFSTEARALTSFDSPINLLAGVYYQKTKRAFDQFVIFGNLEDSTAAPANRYLAVSKDSQTNGETLAAFGQGTWKMSSTLDATAGVRYTHETKNSFFLQPYVNAALSSLFVQGTTLRAHQVFNNWSPEATLTYRPNKGLMLYCAYKTAYKSGGFSNSALYSALSTDPAGDIAFDPETASGFEVGVKTTSLDNQLRVNVDLYTTKYKNLQVDYFNSVIFAYNTVTAEARTKGVELDAELAPRAIPGLDFRASVNYTHARYTKFNGPCYAGQTPAEGCTLFGANGAPFQKLDGAPTAVAPDWTGSIGANYSFAVGRGMSLGLSASGRYSGKYLISGFNNPLSLNRAYTTLDGSIHFGPDDERWQIALIAKNLTNRFYIGGGVDGPSTGSGTGTAAGIRSDQLGFATTPRTVALEARVRF